MKILFCTGHFGFLRNFEHGLRELARRGHSLHLLADRRENMGGTRTLDGLVRDYPGAFTWSFAPSPKTYRWHQLSITLRLCLDYWRYLDPDYWSAPALRARAATQVPPLAVAVGRIPLLRSRLGQGVLRRTVRTLERAIPPAPYAGRLLDEQRPDVVAVTPLLYFGSQQVDYVRSARRRGIPVMLCVGSWDHLTTKGLIHEIPDRVTVWNEFQRDEAARLHGVPSSIVRVTGAQAYDHWFDSRPTLSRDEFCERVGLPSDRPLLLYLCSSPFIAPREVAFARRWIEGLRAHADACLRRAAILVRPHPQNAEQWKDVDLSPYGAAAIWPRAGSNPVDSEARADYFNSMFHSAGVVGVNTSALIESGIVGRPVYSVRGDEFAGTQEGTLHFQHLKNANGGLLSVADTLEEHYAQLSELVHDPAQFANRGSAFIQAFIRPHGLDRPAAPIFADAVEELGSEGSRPAIGPPWYAPLMRPVLYPMAAAADWMRRKRPAGPADGEVARPGPLRLLFVMASPEYLRFFDDTIRALAGRGHTMLVAANIQKDLKPVRFETFTAKESGVRFAGLVPRRGDAWQGLADAVRGTMDFVRYLDPRFEGTSALRSRMKRKGLPRSLAWLDRFRIMPRPVLRALLRGLAAIERAIPSNRRIQQFIEGLRVDGVLVSPLVDAASDQVDIVRSAHALGLPVTACIASWDNLTNKGLLRVQPDLVTVWNETQVHEAVEFHGMPADRVVATGAQPFDRWFEKTPSRTRQQFCAMLGFDPARPIVLFTGSSFFISGEHTEVPFVERWMESLRASADALVAGANILIRPHPYNADQWAAANVSQFAPAAVWPKGGRYNPTDDQNRTDFFDSLFHSAAVVGVNTSAMIEAAIVGRAVHAVLTDDFAATQEGTIHFRYLLPECGGFLRIGRTFDAHVIELARSLRDVDTVRQETGRFVRSFIRPCGVDRPAVPLLADAIERGARAGHTRAGDGTVAILLRLVLAPIVFAWHGARSPRARPQIGLRKSVRMGLHRARKRGAKAARRLLGSGARGGKTVARGGQATWRRASSLTRRGARRVVRVMRHTRYAIAVRLKQGTDR